MEMQTTPGGKIERSNVGTIHTYGIKDPAIVMQTLSSLYQNPRKIVVQEYMSNGRDAHREAGKGDTPIQVTLPTELDPMLRIRDFGVGLNEERVTTVFCWFGESTKRGSNGETGGFGIGAKCGFAYNSRSFIVTSIIEEDGVRIKRLYAAHLNEEEIPQFVGMGEEETDEAIGVEVAIPVPEHDFDYVKQHVKEVSEYWNAAKNSARPIVTNDELEYNDREVVMEGEGWVLYDTEKDSWSGRNGKPFVILDGIQYPIPTDVYEGLDEEAKAITRLNVALSFDTGDIYPAANRENLKFNDQVKDLICERLTECFNLIKQDMQAEIINTATLREANLKWQEVDQHIGSKIVGSVEWRGFKVNGNRINAPGESLVYYYHRSDYEEEGRLKTKKEGHLNWLSLEDAILVFNDELGTCRPSPLRIKTIFKMHPDAKTIQVIHVTTDEDMKKWKEAGFDHLGCQNITKWDKMKQKRAKKGDRVVSKCYKHGELSYHPRRSFWHSHDLDVKNEEGVFVTFHRGTNLDGYSDSDLKWIRREFNIDIIGIPTRFLDKAKENDNMIPLGKFLKDEFAKLVASGPTRSDLACERAFLDRGNLYQVLPHGQDRFFTNASNIALLPKDSCFRKLDRLIKLVKRYAEKHKDDQKFYDKVAKMCEIMGESNPTIRGDYKSRIVDLADECQTMLKCIPLVQAIDYNKVFNLSRYDADKMGEADRDMIRDMIIKAVTDNI